VPEILIRFHPESCHEPGKDSQTERSRTTTELGEFMSDTSEGRINL
jgi:hypothetical protein